MFKSISLKIGSMFVLLTISVIILIGTFMTDTTDRYYHDEFRKINSTVFNSDYVDSLCMLIGNENSVNDIYSSASAYFGQLGIDSFRNFFILDGKSGKPITGLASNEEMSNSLEISPNIITAMNGAVGDEIKSEYSYMDYAVPLVSENGIEYIAYVKDTKEESNTILRNIFTIIIQALLLGIVISLIFAILLSVTIISPIKSLTQKSKQMASGDFSSTIDVNSPDEIGQLTETFNYMANELKQTLSAIQSEKDKVETIVQYMTDGVMAFGVNGEIIHINPAAKKILELKDDEMPSFDQLFSSYEINMGQILYFRHFETLERVIDRGEREISVYFAPFKTEDKTGGVVVVLRDITEREKLDKTRKEFVANVSHELRTPLTTVKSYTETLQEMIADENVDVETIGGFLGVINSEADRMTRLVRDLLLLSSLDHSINDMLKSELDVASLTKGIVEKLQHSAKEKNQTLTYEPTNTIPFVYGNSDRLEQVITNIITNALKYTPDGGNILVSTMHMFNTVTIKVKDNGIGIPQKDIEHIFERFYRVDKARSRQMGGTGLGLAIAKEIIEAHDGSISIKSKPGQGTTVMIKIPVPKG
ncbi:MAG: cell wall metabolism sensor histidine kinase WalK [Ruminococcaceae bacterium]|nr:cell wall metabolism sensor histidine kinase WalK [Oscillospiraceae bacterium]